MSFFNRTRPDPGFVSSFRSDPSFVSPVRSNPGFISPIRSDPVQSAPGFLNGRSVQLCSIMNEFLQLNAFKT